MVGSSTGPSPRGDGNRTSKPGGTTGPTNSKKPMDVWLGTTFLRAEGSTPVPPLDIRDFINFARYESAETAWFTNEMVDWALEAVRAECGISSSSTIVIANTYISRVLCGIGNGTINASPDPDAMAPEDREPLDLRFSAAYKALKGKRYIFLPVNNGMGKEAEIGRQYKKQKEKESREKERKAAEEANNGKEAPTGTDNIGQSTTEIESPETVAEDGESARQPSNGAHWSFILVDTTKNTARYIDSIVEVETSRQNKHKFTNIELNGPTAGTILCGFDTFMGRAKGGFTATTLKWTPHQYHDNSGNIDSGACGPYVYALIKYILQNRSRTLGPGGIKHYFTETQKTDRISGVNFNSVNDRVSLQNLLWKRRKQEEESRAAAEEEVHPINLDPPTLPGVFTPKLLNSLLSPGFLRRLLDIHDPPKDHGYSLEEQAQIWASRQGKPSHKDDEWRKREAFAKHRSYEMPEDQTLEEFRKTIWNEFEPLRLEYNHKHGLPLDDMGPSLGNMGPPDTNIESTGNDTQTQGYDTTKRGELTIPEGLIIPKDFADSKEVDGRALAKWKHTNQYLLKFVIPPKDREKAIDLSYRAALHAWCGRRFAKENDDRSLNIWARDSYAVPHSSSPRTASEIRDLMHKKYELILGHELPEDSTSPPPPPPGDGKPGGKPSAPKKPSKGGGASKDKGGDKGGGASKGKEGDDRGGAGDKETPTDAKASDTEPRKQALEYVKGFRPTKMPQFISDTTNVDAWLAQNPHLLSDWGRQNVHDLTIKALLHRAFKGSFSQNQKRYAHDWIKDPYAFTPEERDLRWTEADMISRMDAVYVDLDPPLFAASPEDEINAWTCNLPEEQKARAASVDKARGLLHRLYIGDFQKLRNPDDRKALTDWCANDPLIVNGRAKGQYQTDEEAVDGLIAFYHPDVTHLPELRHSPLNWPPHEYLASRGQKRKRGSEASAKCTLESAAKRRKKSTFPPGVAHLPYFPYLSGAELELWKKANASNIHPALDDEKANESEWRARLWLLFNASFGDETHENLAKGWLLDRNVFSVEQRTRRVGHALPPDQIAEMMRARYERGERRGKRVPAGQRVGQGGNQIEMVEESDDDAGDVTVQDPNDRTYVE